MKLSWHDAVGMQFRKRLLIALIPLCLFVAGYSFIASQASGGWHTNEDGEPSYTSPVRHSREFYDGLRWSVFVIGGIMAIVSYCWDHPRFGTLFAAFAVLFNPLLRLHMQKESWEVFDILCFWLFFLVPLHLWEKTAEATK